MTISTLGAIVGLVVAIVLIIYKAPPVYGMMLGAIVGGLVGGASLADTVSFMVTGASGMASGITRIIAAGMLAGFLIKSGSAETIAYTIVEKMGEKYALLACILAAWVLQVVGTFGDVIVVIIAPIALEVAARTNYSRGAAVVAIIGGIHAGNVVSPNANTISLAENFGLPLTTVMLGGLVPSVFGLIATFIFMQVLKSKGEMIDINTLEVTGKRDDLPPFWKAIIGPVVTIVLLMLRAFAGITIDPIIALPMGGVVGTIVTGHAKEIVSFAETGISRMSSIVLLLLGTGTISGIIANSALKTTLTALVEASGMPGYLLAPISGIVMGGATASCMAGASTASSIFGSTITGFGVSAIGAAVMIHAGCCVFDCLPHGSFFHISAGSLGQSIKERLKIIPFESGIGLVMTIAATIVYGMMGFTFGV